MTDLLRAVLRRSESILLEDLVASMDDLEHQVGGARVLVIGAAGSIGSAFARQVVALKPAALHLVDPAENNLVELVRDLRSSLGPVPSDFRTLPLPMGGPEFMAFIRSQRAYDFILNFAAVKHVRSEKDPFSLMHMINTNVLSLRDLLAHLTPEPRIFSVSSDKAVNPENAMGASKALMERVLLAYSDKFTSSSARFANVAFSDGSLLHSFGQRIAKGQPLVAPQDVRRYFISSEEAAQLCLLAGFLSANREIFVPRLDPDVNLLTFAEIALIYLDSVGLRPVSCSSEEEAKSRAQSRDAHAGTWPCFFFDSDTTGEKMVEEFVAADEVADWNRFRALGVIGAKIPGPAVTATVEKLAAMRAAETWSKEAILDLLRTAVPDFKHVEKGRSLDDRM